MSVIVLLLGILAAGAGLGAIGFAVPVLGTDLGNTLINAGATGLTGGLILFGIAAAVGQLARIAEGLRARGQRTPRPLEAPLQRPEAPPVAPRPESVSARAEPVAPLPDIAPFAPRTAPEPRLTASPTDVSSSAIERLRSTLPRPDRVVPEAEEVPLSPDGTANPSAPEPRIEPFVPMGRSAPASEESPPPRQQRLDFLFRTRAPAPAAPDVPSAAEPSSNPFESMWPKRPMRMRDPQPPGDDTERSPGPAPAISTEPVPAEDRREPELPAAPVVEEAPSVAILKSGVVDGMAYTLYADGSIEAQLPQGTVRFASITELRAHIETNS